MKTFYKFLDLLSQRERNRAVMLLGMILIMALLDMIGVASIMPFITVLANPELIETNLLLSKAFFIANRFGFYTKSEFLFVLGILVFILLLISLSFKALTSYAQLHFALMREYSIGMRLVEGYLHQPYSWFLSRHSAQLGKNILSEVSAVIGGGVTPMMTLIAQGAVAIALMMLLIIVDHQLALVVGLTLAGAYTIIYKATRGLLSRIGVERVRANLGRFTAVSEAFGASKEIKVMGLERIYIERFSVPAKIYARHQATASVIIQLPRFALEAIAFGGMLIVILYLMAQRDSFSSALPIVALYAFAGYRLMPALQQIYGAVSQLRYVGPALDSLHADLISLKADSISKSHEILVLKNSIELNNITYTYPNSVRPALKNLSLTIPAKSTVGFVGSTGCGKTTTVDLILALLDPQEGSLEVDGQVISGTKKRTWQRAIGYVPQQIYLADDTVAANIAFGVNPEDIDYEAVVRVAKIANLHNFVTSELPQQYEAVVGERGVRLSGGQRQRIGIARALYCNPQVLIMDEATSALDNLTEQSVMEAVNGLRHGITVILIAHRLSTVKNCDTIFLMEGGLVKAQGTFDQLSQVNEQFRAMAKS